MALTLFYDGRCPLCVAEMESLRRHDHHQRLQLEDIFQPGLQQRYPQLDLWRALQVLHAVDEKGRWWFGLDVTARAWSLVGVKRYNWLRWPFIRPLADICYRAFARHRYTLSLWLTGRARICDSNRCNPGAGKPGGGW
ncbi:thiol-disulfide oxidoreductase DCC family protein [Pseudomaricurvus sp. HS19]|uniref:thiol-disulfide oxidoreductase DCC family protein n=1 Tax=Pseudomaricurvus sp. HS19 TaxID=2692626 RepID=UPI00136AA872|nr:DUF393 domain-containing protein [Pseudomaricurvus sp. HS19]MYM63639.1 DUF393 domain-containing protein [Pseudomaricurvus sp. HS19]